jgi:hypothetical protein
MPEKYWFIQGTAANKHSTDVNVTLSGKLRVAQQENVF